MLNCCVLLQVIFASHPPRPADTPPAGDIIELLRFVAGFMVFIFLSHPEKVYRLVNNPVIGLQLLQFVVFSKVFIPGNQTRRIDAGRVAP